MCVYIDHNVLELTLTANTALHRIIIGTGTASALFPEMHYAVKAEDVERHCAFAGADFANCMFALTTAYAASVADDRVYRDAIRDNIKMLVDGAKRVGITPREVGRITGWMF